MIQKLKICQDRTTVIAIAWHIVGVKFLLARLMGGITGKHV